jgi:nucleoside 2-deoxyribosyltransferase
MSTIVFCSSANFYKHVNELAAQLEANGFTIVVPKTARRMRASGNYDVDAVKTWYGNPDDFTVKADLMRGHFDEIANGDVILVVNDKKHDIDGYIGPNVLMEMGLAFYLRKPIYVLNNIDKNMPVYEEVLGMGSQILNGDLTKIPNKSEKHK